MRNKTYDVKVSELKLHRIIYPYIFLSEIFIDNTTCALLQENLMHKHYHFLFNMFNSINLKGHNELLQNILKL